MSHRFVTHSIGIVLLNACLGRAASAQTPPPKPPTADDLRAEIAQLESDIDPLVKLRLGDPASVRVDLSAAPISRLFADINTKPAKLREVSYEMTSASGGIAHVESECKVWFVS